MRVGDVLISQVGADARPCVLELRLGVVEIGTIAAFDTRLRPARDSMRISGPLSQRLVELWFWPDNDTECAFGWGVKGVGSANVG